MIPCSLPSHQPPSKALHLPSPRHLSSMPPSIPSINWSSNTNPPALTPRLTPLLQHWTLTPNNDGLSRAFYFKTFKTTWAFMNEVAAECVTHRHHPEWSNVYDCTFIRWTTHNPRGLSELDLSMAEICDGIAEKLGEVKGEEGGKGEAAGAGAREMHTTLADTVVSMSGDCCSGGKSG